MAINLHYLPETIVQHFGDGARLGVTITYSHEPLLLGSAGAAKLLERYFGETFLVLYGDVLTDLDLTRLIAQHRSTGAAATLALYEVADPERCGIVQLGPGGRVQRFVEKPAGCLGLGNLANAGIYVFEPAVLDLVPAAQQFDFGHDVFPVMLERGWPVYGYLGPDYVLDIGSVERYAEAQLALQAGRFRTFCSAPGGVHA